MNSLFKAGLEIQHTLKSQKWPFCFIGGLAVIRWGEVRESDHGGTTEIFAYENQ